MIEPFLSAFVQWASGQADIVAVALAGSHARGTAKSSSDVDLLILTSDPGRYLADTGWARRFGPVDREQLEDWGRVTSVRVWYRDWQEVEFGFTTPDWAAEPIDEGTRRVIRGGMRVLFDREEYLSSAIGESG